MDQPETTAGVTEPRVAIEHRLLALWATTGLENQLRAAAAVACHRAVTALPDLPEATMQAGQALEHLAKAVVFAHQPEALTTPKAEDSVAFLLGEGYPGLTHLGQIYTINGRKAVTKAFQYLGMTASQADVDAVFDARNASAHLGFADWQTGYGAVGAMMRLVGELLGHEGTTIAAWIDEPDLQPIIELLSLLPVGTDAFARSTPARVGVAIWRARAELEALRTRLPAAAWEAVLSVEPELDPREEEVLQPCPACETSTWFILRWEESDAQDNDDPENYVDEEGYLGGMRCRVCGLELDDDEVESIGRDEIVETRTVER